MSKYYQFLDEGSLILPITEGAAFFTDSMSADYDKGYCYIDFYSDAGATVRADGGGIVVKFESTPTPTGRTEQYQESPTGDITASTVFDGTYDQPYFAGAVTRSKVTFTNVTGTFYARAWHWRT